MQGSWPGEGAPEVDEVAREDVAVEAEPEAAEVDEPDAGAPDAEEPDEDEGAGEDEDTGDEEPELRGALHREGELDIPDDVDALEGEPRSTRRGVGIVVSRARVEVGNRLLESALAELDRAGVEREQVLVMAVPGPFELPLAAMALAKTRRYACIVALGSATGSPVVAAEAASGLQLAGLETGVPIAFGVLTEAGSDEAGEEHAAAAVRSALEMADLFHQLRAAAKAG